MAIDLSTKRVPVVGYVRMKNPDGSFMVDEDGVPSYARMHSPSSKRWQTANADLRRKALKRVREGGGKIEAMADSPEDTIQFLTDITEEFINVSVDLPEGASGAKALVSAIYNDPELGFVRDQMADDGKDWSSFLPQPPTSSTSGSDISHG